MKLRNAWYLNEEDHVIQGDLVIHQNRIAEFCNDSEELDCSHLLVLPGMVNAHFHGTSHARLVYGYAGGAMAQ